MGADVSRWMYVLIGRLIYEVGELDGWQVLPFLKGAASSGKSTILTRVCRGLYEAADVGTLSNNIERKFGLSALADKLIFIGPEIKSDIALEQVTFSLSQSESPPASGGGLSLGKQKLDQNGARERRSRRVTATVTEEMHLSHNVAQAEFQSIVSGETVQVRFIERLHHPLSCQRSVLEARWGSRPEFVDHLLGWLSGEGGSRMLVDSGEACRRPGPCR
jgi:hypothetical protein